MSNASPDRTPDGTAARCTHCGALRAGAFCGACGQPAITGRFTLRRIFGRLASDLFDLDRGLFHTALALLQRPGHVALDYVRGRTVCYASPVKYFVLIVTAAQLLSMQMGILSEIVKGFADAAAEAERTAGGADEAHAAGFLGEYFVALAAAAVPLLAAMMRLLFRRVGFNYAEHLIFALYASAQQFLFFVVVIAVVDVARVKALFVVYLVAAWGYQVGASRQFLGVSYAAAFVRTTAAVVVTGVLGLGLLGALLDRLL